MSIEKNIQTMKDLLRRNRPRRAFSGLGNAGTLRRRFAKDRAPTDDANGLQR
jgi:hypothetical protein